VSQLEEELGHALFDRIGRTIRLNENGKKLLPEVQEILVKVGLLSSLGQKFHSAFKGNIRVGASPFLASHVLAPAWLKFLRENPGATADLEAPESSVAIARVLRGDLEAALVFSPQSHPDLDISEVISGDLVISVRAIHPVLKVPRSARLKSLSEYPSVFHRGVAGIELCRALPSLLELGLKTQVIATFENDEQALALLSHSNAWALLPEIVVKASRGKLVPLLSVEGPMAKYRICWVTRARDQSTRPWFDLLQRQVKVVLRAD